jgi:hypothetical protein
LVRFEFESGTVHWFYLYIVLSGNYVCLSRGVLVAGAAWCALTRIMAGVGDLMQRTGDDRTGRVLSGRAIEGRVTSCAVYTVHVEMRSMSFLVEP